MCVGEPECVRDSSTITLLYSETLRNGTHASCMLRGLLGIGGWSYNKNSRITHTQARGQFRLFFYTSSREALKRPVSIRGDLRDSIIFVWDNGWLLNIVDFD